MKAYEKKTPTIHAGQTLGFNTQKSFTESTLDVNDFHPITLLLALEAALGYMVGNHQSGGIKGRSMITNLHRMRSACEAA